MNIQFSDILSLAALAVSVGSMAYARSQRDIARQSYFNDYRSHLTEHHSVYQKQLMAIKKQHKGALRELSSLAENTLTGIVHDFDMFDTNRNADRRLRHLIHECSEMIFYAFRGQLGWQTAENITHRLQMFAQIEDNIAPQKHLFGKGSFRTVAREKYRANHNQYLEMTLIHDVYFCSLVTEIMSRVDDARASQLLDNIQPKLDVFNLLHDRLRPSFSASAEHLEEIISEGNTEHFQLIESPQLYDEIHQNKATFSTLSRLSVSPPGLTTPGNYYYFVSRSIHACAILHMIQGVHGWGWK